MYCVWRLKFLLTLPPQILSCASLMAQLVRIPAVPRLWEILRLQEDPGERKSYPLQYCNLENSMGTIQSMGINDHDWMNGFQFLHIKTKSDSGLFHEEFVERIKLGQFSCSVCPLFLQPWTATPWPPCPCSCAQLMSIKVLSGQPISSFSSPSFCTDTCRGASRSVLLSVAKY